MGLFLSAVAATLGAQPWQECDGTYPDVQVLSDGTRVQLPHIQAYRRLRCEITAEGKRRTTIGVRLTNWAGSIPTMKAECLVADNFDIAGSVSVASIDIGTSIDIELSYEGKRTGQPALNLMVLPLEWFVPAPPYEISVCLSSMGHCVPGVDPEGTDVGGTPADGNELDAGSTADPSAAESGGDTGSPASRTPRTDGLCESAAARSMPPHFPWGPLVALVVLVAIRRRWSATPAKASR